MSEYKLSHKQWEVWNALDDPEINEVFAGGSAGGGKSFLGCLRQIYRRTKYPGTRGFIGRETFTGLRDSTMKTYFELLQGMGYRSGEHYTYNAQEHTVKFISGSEQHFRHMAYQPSDPDYNRFGSTEYTDAFIDEAPEVDVRAAQVLLSRLRYKHVEHNLTPEVLYTGNPGDHWIKYRFVQDENDVPVVLEKHRACVLFGIQDNPNKAFRDGYSKTLEHLDDYDKARLLYGDWNARKDVLRPFAHAYDEKKHVGDCKHNPNTMTMVLVDFNIDPYCANIYNAWKDSDGIHCHQVSEVEIKGGTIQEMAEQIKSNVGKAINTMYLGGDAMGNNRTIGNRDNKSLFSQLLTALGIGNSQLRVVHNPGHGTSRADVNYFLKHYPDFKIDRNCTGTRRDLRSVEVDSYGSIMKKNRSDVSQRADFLDCFVGDTMVEMNGYQKRIMDINIGEMVISDKGPRMVVDKWQSVRDVYEFEFSNGEKVVCTKSHKFCTKSGYMEICRIFERNIDIWQRKKSCTTELGTLSTQIRNTTIAHSQKNSIQDAYIGKCGLMQMEKFQKVCSFITKMAMPTIIHWQTLSWSTEVTMPVCTFKSGLRTIRNTLSDSTKKELRPLQNGIDRIKAKSGTMVTEKELGLDILHTEIKTVSNAEKNFLRKTPMLGFATTIANQHGEEPTTRISLSPNAKNVKTNLRLKSIKPEDFAQENADLHQTHTALKVVKMTYKGHQKVYDITVDDRRCFHANGVLVHNCVRYAINTFYKKAIEYHQKTGQWPS